MLLSFCLFACGQAPVALVRAPIADAQTVSIQVFFLAGSAYESETEAGITHLVEHLLFRRGEPGRLDQAIERLGGRLEATTYRDLLRIWCTVPKEHALDAAAVLRQAVAPLSISALDLEAEKKMVAQELRLQSLDTERAVLDLLWQSSAAGSGYALSTGGRKEAVETLTLPSVLAWSRRFLGRERLMLVVSGSVSIEQASKMRALFDDVPDGEAGAQAPHWAQATGYTMARFGDVLGIGFRAPSPTEAHAYAAWMIAWEVLAGADGAAQRLGLACRPRLDPTRAGTMAALLFRDASEEVVLRFLRSGDAQSASDAAIAEAQSAVEARWLATLGRPEERAFWEGAMRVWGGQPAQGLLDAVRRCGSAEVRAVLASLGRQG